MSSIRITLKMNDVKVNNKPARFDMAISFYCIVKEDNKFKIVTYFYSPAWGLFYPFYDAINKTPILHDSRADTYGQLIDETDDLLQINEKEKVDLAKKEFKRIFGTECEVVRSEIAPIIYELKYSKTSKLYTMYKLFNYLVVSVDDKQKMLEPSSMPCRLYDIDHLGNCKIVTNAKWFIKDAKSELKEHAIN